MISRKIPVSIGIDLGGTMIKGVLMQHDGTILNQLIRETQDEGKAAVFSWKEGIKAVVSELKPKGKANIPIGICAPGLPDAQHQSIAYMPGRLQGLEHLNWGEYLAETQVYVLNDANAAMMAEHQFGAGIGKQHLVLLTLGTGVGGAIIIDRKLYKGWLNRAGHLGHLSQHPFGEAGIVNLPGTLEMAIGNATVSERSKGRFKSTYELVEGYKKGDAWASLVWLESIKNLATGISSLINILSPELIILSGGIIQAEEALFQPLATFMDLFEWRPGDQPTPIVKAHFTAFAGAVGAASFAREKARAIEGPSHHT
ncbi:MAG: ROK family protein [Bacteroidota bacterium]